MPQQFNLTFIFVESNTHLRIFIFAEPWYRNTFLKSRELSLKVGMNEIITFSITFWPVRTSRKDRSCISETASGTITWIKVVAMVWKTLTSDMNFQDWNNLWRWSVSLQRNREDFLLFFQLFFYLVSLLYILLFK